MHWVAYMLQHFVVSHALGLEMADSPLDYTPETMFSCLQCHEREKECGCCYYRQVLQLHFRVTWFLEMIFHCSTHLVFALYSILPILLFRRSNELVSECSYRCNHIFSYLHMRVRMQRRTHAGRHTQKYRYILTYTYTYTYTCLAPR